MGLVLIWSENKTEIKDIITKEGLAKKKFIKISGNFLESIENIKENIEIIIQLGIIRINHIEIDLESIIDSLPKPRDWSSLKLPSKWSRKKKFSAARIIESNNSTHNIGTKRFESFSVLEPNAKTNIRIPKERNDKKLIMLFEFIKLNFNSLFISLTKSFIN